MQRKEYDRASILLTLVCLKEGYLRTKIHTNGWSKGNQDEAKTLCKRILQQNKTCLPAIEVLAKIAFKQGDWRQAAEWYTKAWK